MSLKVGFLGGGRMAKAIRDGLCASKNDVPIAVYDPQLDESWHHQQVCATPEELFASAEVLIWAIKPQVFKAESETWHKLAGCFKGKLWVSIMAGVTTSALEALSPTCSVVRTMPNTPLLHGVGMTVLTPGKGVKEAEMALATSLFSPVSKTLELPESAMDGVTAISGSGPAYFFRLAEEMLQMSEKIGVPREISLQLMSQTLRGAAEMLDKAKATPAELRAQVTSPGGTTAAALKTMEEGGFASSYVAGLRSAYERSIELSG